jgi:hypothetical protein
MTDKYIIYESLNIDYNLFFTATDEEIQKAEAREEARAEELKNIFFAPDFCAAEYTEGNGSRHILHHSTRPGVLYQLSYIAPDGIPTSHENIKQDNIKELLKHFIFYNSRHALKLHIITS